MLTIPTLGPEVYSTLPALGHLDPKGFGLSFCSVYLEPGFPWGPRSSLDPS